MLVGPESGLPLQWGRSKTERMTSAASCLAARVNDTLQWGRSKTERMTP